MKWREKATQKLILPLNAPTEWIKYNLRATVYWDIRCRIVIITPISWLRRNDSRCDGKKNDLFAYL